MCSNTPGSYLCSCNPGWSGRDCDVNIDECLANGGAGQTCKNNGTCIDGINTFTCDCQPGFTGDLCEVDIDECAPRPCQNGATCVDGVNSFSCDCTPRFMGSTCSLPYDPCASAPCLNGALCRKEQEERMGGQDYSCSCVRGFQGTNCEVGLQLMKYNYVGFWWCLFMMVVLKIVVGKRHHLIGNVQCAQHLNVVQCQRFESCCKTTEKIGGLMLYIVNRRGQQYHRTLSLSSPLKGKFEREAAGSESKLLKFLHSCTQSVVDIYPAPIFVQKCHLFLSLCVLGHISPRYIVLPQSALTTGEH